MAAAMFHVLALALVAAAMPTAVPARTSAAVEQEGSAVTGERLMQEAPIKAALDRLKSDEPALIENQISLCEIPAPPFEEAARAAAYKRAFEALGLTRVRID